MITENPVSRSRVDQNKKTVLDETTSSRNETPAKATRCDRRIALVGAGHVGLLTAHALCEHGYRVTVYSDRSADDWLYRSPPGGAVVRFGDALDWEREVRLGYWEDSAPRITGAHLTLCAKVGNRLATLAGRFDRPAQAVDLRLQCHRWMNELERRGATLEIDRVTVERLDEIAAENDLVIVAAGRGPIGEIFERDPGRSPYSAPQRHLASAIVRGPVMSMEGVPFLPVKINLVGPHGECFFAPYHHRDHGPTWAVLFEARPGGALDRFAGVGSAAELVSTARNLIKEMLPWDWAWAKDMEVADEHAWLAGEITPTTRVPVGRLPSGRVVMGLGETVMTFDPIAGQGANTSYRMARGLIRDIVAHGDRRFDEAFMRRSFEDFYREHGHAASHFSHTLLEPMTPAGQELLIAQYGSDGTDHGDPGRQALADAIAQNFCDPSRSTHLFHDIAAARRFIAETTSRPWWYAAARGRLGIGRGQLRQAVGASPGHPVARTRPVSLEVDSVAHGR